MGCSSYNSTVSGFLTKCHADAVDRVFLAVLSWSSQMSATTLLQRQTEGSKRKQRMRNSRSGSHQQMTYDSPQTSPNHRIDGRSNSCCFCCINMKNTSASNTSRKDTKLGSVVDKDDLLTVDEIKSWGESFERLMKSGRKVFREFLRSEYSEENMLFWLACEELKQEASPELVEEKARLIYEDYISILSPKEVSLDARVRDVINRNMVDPTPHTFDEAQLQIFTLMHRDSYPRFLNSQMYKKLVQQIS